MTNETKILIDESDHAWLELVERRFFILSTAIKKRMSIIDFAIDSHLENLEGLTARDFSEQNNFRLTDSIKGIKDALALKKIIEITTGDK